MRSAEIFSLHTQFLCSQASALAHKSGISQAISINAQSETESAAKFHGVIEAIAFLNAQV